MEHNFIGKDNWRNPFPIDSKIELPVEDKDVRLPRGAMFFYAGEVTKFSRVKAHFTDFAIEKLIHDGFIEFL